MENSISNIIAEFLVELDNIKQSYSYQIANDIISANWISDAQALLDNLETDASLLDEDVLEKGCAALEEVADNLANRSALRNEWQEPEVIESTNYIYTSDLDELLGNLKDLDQQTRNKFKQRLATIRSDFSLQNNYDTGKFEQANNHVIKLKKECEDILKSFNINGHAWEIKCNGSAAVRFAGIQDNTNHRWFILPAFYLHRNNASDAQDYWLKKAASDYCNYIGQLEEIPIDLAESYISELDQLTEELTALLELDIF